MTSVDLLFRYAAPPTEATASALAKISEVYGIRKLNFDRAAGTLCVEYDATRLNAATVSSLVRQAGLEIEADLPPISSEQAPDQAPIA